MRLQRPCQCWAQACVAHQAGLNLLLLHRAAVVLCRVHHRTAESVVGALSLNLTVDPKTASAPAAVGSQQAQAQLSPLGAVLAAALEALAPRCLALPLSVATLNGRPWWPCRNQNSQRLISGPLQMTRNTQVGKKRAVGFGYNNQGARGGQVAWLGC